MTTKLVLLVLLLLVVIPGIGAAMPEAIRADVEAADLQVIAAARGAAIDSCGTQWLPPLYYLWEFAQTRCEATRCEFAGSLLIDAVQVVWFNYGDVASEKPVEVFLWADADDLPGDVLWSLQTTTSLLAPGETRLVQYDVEPPVETQVVWLGHYETVAGPPSSLFDEFADGTHASSAPPCGSVWNAQFLGDYLQLLSRSGASTGITAAAPLAPSSIAIEGVVPRAGGEFLVKVVLGSSESACVRVYAPTGRMLSEATPEPLFGPGHFTVSWDARRTPAGVYFVTLASPTARDVRKVLVVR